LVNPTPNPCLKIHRHTTHDIYVHDYYGNVRFRLLPRHG
jgi:hypothetical protein